MTLTDAARRLAVEARGANLETLSTEDRLTILGAVLGCTEPRPEPQKLDMRMRLITYASEVA